MQGFRLGNQQGDLDPFQNLLTFLLPLHNISLQSVHMFFLVILPTDRQTERQANTAADINSLPYKIPV